MTLAKTDHAPLPNNMTGQPVKIAVGTTGDAWDKRFVLALDEKAAQGFPLTYEYVELRRHDWLAVVRPFDVVIWKPHDMGVLGASHFKEKVYVLEKHLGKTVLPNYNTIWHFESKVAQSYLFAIEGVPTPATTVTFDHHDAQRLLQAAAMPLVCKQSHGAASRQVRLVRSRRQALGLVVRAFSGDRYREARMHGESRYKTILKIAWRRWFWDFLLRYGLGWEPAGYLYWQEFIRHNDADLRITVIGDRYAYGFWRQNRPEDFRASGSGKIDFERPVPEEPLRYCLQLSRRLDFDSMAYDLLFKDNRFVITEMSYGYLDSVPYKTRGHYELHEDGRLEWISGSVWPQSLWVAWALQRAVAAQRRKLSDG